MKTETPPVMLFSATDEDVIFAECRSLKVDLSAAMQIVADRLEFTHQKKHYFVCDLSKVQSVTAEAKKYLQHPDGGLKNILGAALIASNPVAALIANVFVKTPKDFQARFFSNRKDAFDWIHARKQKSLT
ncbi:MAG TPA: hypothetical protein VL728_15945 [Cyclobacteriaceae bacterium]|nr:hypothetical protein [Cyclobacteriaceae bacterium]